VAALDTCEQQIIRALQNQGWSLVDKPFTLRTDGHTILADFSIQRRVNGNTEQVVVLEVKCFTNQQQDLPEIYKAVGQYQLYKAALRANKLTFALYLAIPATAFSRLNQDPVIKATLSDAKIKLVIIDIAREVVTQWIN
jgi:uncharacterized Fe-S cluster-containing radical SAM superfamily protein